MSQGIRVRVTRAGYIGGQYKSEGSEFTLLKPELFSKTWMEKIEDSIAPDDQPVSEPEEALAELAVRRRKRPSF